MPIRPPSTTGAARRAYTLLVPFLLLCASATFAQSTRATVEASSRLWESADWKKCLQNFSRTAKPAMYPTEKRLLSGVCADKERSRPAQEGECFMEAVSPSDLLSATRVEVKLLCLHGTREVMTCTNKMGHYMEAMTAGMKGNPKCDGFPDLLTVDMRKKGPNRALETLGGTKSGSAGCAAQVRKIQRLEADPRFDIDRSVRQRWSEEVAMGTRMHCSF